LFHLGLNGQMTRERNPGQRAQYGKDQDQSCGAKADRRAGSSHGCAGIQDRRTELLSLDGPRGRGGGVMNDLFDVAEAYDARLTADLTPAGKRENA